MYPRSMLDSDLVVIQGSNMAECHPVAFRWVAKAKLAGAKLIHVDPRFTRTSAMADIHAAIRAGTDVAFLGGLINHVINSERWNTEPFFREYVVNYTNAATIVGDEFKGAEEMDGVFSGLLEAAGGAKEWPYNALLGRYDNKTWQYAAGDGRGLRARVGGHDRLGRVGAAIGRERRDGRVERRQQPVQGQPHADHAGREDEHLLGVELHQARGLGRARERVELAALAGRRVRDARVDHHGLRVGEVEVLAADRETRGLHLVPGEHGRPGRVRHRRSTKARARPDPAR